MLSLSVPYATTSGPGIDSRSLNVYIMDVNLQQKLNFVYCNLCYGVTQENV